MRYLAHRDIINKLTSDGALFRCQGIIECLEGRIKDPEIIAAISSLKDDGVIIMGGEFLHMHGRR